MTITARERLVVDRDALYLGTLPGAGWYIVNLLIFIIMPSFSSRPDKKTFVGLSLALTFVPVQSLFRI